MPRACTVCTHAERSAIDQDLADGQAYRAIAHSHGVSKSALLRHQQHQAPRAVTDTVSVTGHLADQAVSPTVPYACPCSQGDWSALTAEAEQLHTVISGMQDPMYALYALRAMAALLVRLTAALGHRV